MERGEGGVKMNWFRRVDVTHEGTRTHITTRYFRAELTFMDTDLLFFGQLLQLAICRMCRYHEIDELFSIESKKSDQMVSGDCGKGDLAHCVRYLKLTCPVEDCPPSFIHHPGKTGSLGIDCRHVNTQYDTNPRDKLDGELPNHPD